MNFKEYLSKVIEEMEKLGAPDIFSFSPATPKEDARLIAHLVMSHFMSMLSPHESAFIIIEGAKGALADLNKTQTKH